MKIIDSCSRKDLFVSDAVILSGVRPSGRGIDHLADGRMRHGLLYIWSGEAQFAVADGKRVRAVSHDLLFLPKGCHYRMQYTAPQTTFVLVNFDMFDRSGEVALSPDITVLQNDSDTNRIANIMASFELCSASENLSAVFRKKELLYRLLSAIYQNVPTAAEACGPYSRIMAGALLLEQSYLENIPISRLAQASSVSEGTFRTLFHKQYGVSPVQYRIRLRLKRAKTLLKEDDCTIAEVAYACGFENIGYFCRAYKRAFGETPGETKKALR